MRNDMPIEDVIAQLGRLREIRVGITKGSLEDNPWQDDVDAFGTAISILAALLGDGCKDFEQVLDVLQDYKSLAKQYQAMHKKFQVAEKPFYQNSMWHCPDCNRRTYPYRSYCHCCGKKLKWR